MPTEPTGSPRSGAPPTAPAKGLSMKLILCGGVFVVLLAAGSFLIASNNQSLGQKPPTGRGVIATTKNAPGAIPEVQVAKRIRRDVAATLRLPATISPYYKTTLYA